MLSAYIASLTDDEQTLTNTTMIMMNRLEEVYRIMHGANEQVSQLWI